MTCRRKDLFSFYQCTRCQALSMSNIGETNVEDTAMFVDSRCCGGFSLQRGSYTQNTDCNLANRSFFKEHAPQVDATPKTRRFFCACSDEAVLARKNKQANHECNVFFDKIRP